MMRTLSKAAILSIIYGITLASSSSWASSKEEFIKAAKTQCNLNQAAANELATGGRIGTVILFKLCRTPQVKTDNPNCTVICTKKSSKIGGL